MKISCITTILAVPFLSFATASANPLVDIARQWDSLEKSGSSPQKIQAIEKKQDSLVRRTATSSSREMETLISGLHSATDIRDDIRRELITLTVTKFAEKQPMAALNLVTGSPELFGDAAHRNLIVTESLKRIASNNPQAAIDWMQKHKASPGLVDDDMRIIVISLVASKDPKFAFTLIEGLPTAKKPACFESIAVGAGLIGQRTTIVLALREYVAGLKDPKEKDQAVFITLRTMGTETLRTDEAFESATRWAESARLTPDEISAYSHGIASIGNAETIDPWLGWMTRSLPADKSKPVVSYMFANFTKHTPDAADKWLATAPDGDMKTTALISYVKTLSPYRPQLAAKRAVTLPAGEERGNLIRQIHKDWAAKDPAAAAEFAKQQGIE